VATIASAMPVAQELFASFSASAGVDIFSIMKKGEINKKVKKVEKRLLNMY